MGLKVVLWVYWSMGDKISEHFIIFAGFMCWDDACHKKKL